MPWPEIWVVSMLMVVGAFGMQVPVSEDGHVSPHHEVISVPLRRETVTFFKSFTAISGTS